MWFVHDDGERKARVGAARVAEPALDSGAKRAILLIDHRDNGGDAARHGGARAMFEIVERLPGRRRGEVRMQVDASGQQELSAGVDLAIGWSDRADGCEPTARDRAVRARVSVAP